jgi:hypothetical protein
MSIVVQNNWTPDIETVLDHIRFNSVLLSKEHKTRYFYLKKILRYFRLPIIVISSVNSVISVGFQNYISQTTISLINCMLALFCSLVASIEMYLAINRQMEDELMAAKEFYFISIDIFKVLQLQIERRPPDGKAYLEDRYKLYIKLVETSHLSNKRITDKLTPINYTPSIVSNNSFPSIECDGEV